MKNVIIELTDEQIQKLGTLKEIAENEALKGNLGAIMAQVFPENLYKKMICTFCANAEVKKMYKALGKTPPL